MIKSYKLFNLIISLFKILDKKRKYQFLGILIINIVNGLFEFLSLGSALLFLEALTDPNLISSSFNFIFNIFIIKNDYELIQLATFIFLIITLVTTIIRILNLWLNTKFRISFLNFISNKLYKKVITQNYSFYLKNNSSDILTDITSNIEKTNFFFENLLTLLTSLILSISIIFSLLKLNYYITILSVIIFTFLYTLLGLFINKKVTLWGRIEFDAYSSRNKLIQEGLNAIKDIILTNNHNTYIKKFKSIDHELRTYQGFSGFITTFPRYLFEGIGLIFIGISGFLIYINISNSGNIIALLGAFALGAQKLLPSMQSSYKSWSLLYFYSKGLNRILKLFKLKEVHYHNSKEKLTFENEIKIKNLDFFYSKSNKNISKNINLIIKKGENVGIFGKTGSGKTTLINIFMGILTPVSGNIFIDKLGLFNNEDKNILSKWKNNIAHVPQDVFLFDSSILENIAFCIDKNKIDFQRVKEAAKIANCHEFISKKTNGYKTFVGEKGVKLSGGQKQRIGLARAIYTNSEILILDESTSALDFKTEKSVIESLSKNKYCSKLTTITIAHRLSTLRYCDKIVELNNGTISAIYNNEEFVNNFKKLF